MPTSFRKKYSTHTHTHVRARKQMLTYWEHTCTQTHVRKYLESHSCTHTHTHIRHTTQTPPCTQPQIQTRSCMCTHGQRLASTQFLPRADRCSSAITLSDSAVKNLRRTELSGWALIILNLTESPLQCAHSASELSREEGFKDSSDKDKKKKKHPDNCSTLVFRSLYWTNHLSYSLIPYHDSHFPVKLKKVSTFFLELFSAEA